MSHLLFSAAAIAVGSIAAVTDYKTGRIPNQLTFSTMFVGLATNCLAGGLSGLLRSLAGLCVCATVPAVIYKASQGRGIGGGDIKLFAGLGALLGITQGLEAELSSFLLLAVFAMVRLAFDGQLTRTIARSLRVTAALFVPNLRFRDGELPLAMTEMRMGPAIALGVVSVLVLPYVVRWFPWLG